MEALLGILLGVGVLLALRPRRSPRRALLPAEAEAHSRRAEPALLEARIAHVEALTAAVREAPGAGLRELEAAMADSDTSPGARGALLWLKLQKLEVDEAAYVTQALLSKPGLRDPALRALVELAADGNPASSRRLLEVLESDAALASAARPVLWSLLIAGPFDIECRAIARLGDVGDAEDAKDLLRHFGTEPELYDRVRGATYAIQSRNGAHALSIVDEDELGDAGQLSLQPE